MSDNHQWYLEQDFSEYAGEWIVIVGEKVVASGKSVEKIMKKLKGKGIKRPFVAKIPEKVPIIG